MIENTAETQIHRKTLAIFNVLSSKLTNRKLRGRLQKLLATTKTKRQAKLFHNKVSVEEFRANGTMLLTNVSPVLCRGVIKSAKTSKILAQDFENFTSVNNLSELPASVNSALIFPDLDNGEVLQLLKIMVDGSVPIAAAYLGGDVIIDDVKIMYSKPGEGVGPQFFHRDWDTLGFVKVFCYLNDVGSDNGMHQYVKGSINSSKLNRHGRFSDQEVHGAFATDDVLSIPGKAGTIFIEDTNGLHRGLPLLSGERWVVSIRLSLFGSMFREKDRARRNSLNGLL